MPIDPENIKKALDKFEDDEYTDARDILKAEIRKARDEYINREVGIEKQEPESDEKEEEEEEDE